MALVLLVTFGLLGLTGPQSCTPFTIYTLRSDSTFTRGCFGPCLCPVELGQGFQGFFVLIEDTGSPASPFRDFEVNDVQWSVELGGQTVPITGSDHYRVGGEVALTQQLTLDLQVAGGPVEHFDSGVVAGSSFPVIDITVSVSGAFCFNTMIKVDAQPLTPAQ
jgi:hypothetical protein